MGRLRLALFVGAISGPIIAMGSSNNQARIDEIQRSGVEAVASVSNYHSIGGKGRSYYVDLTWTDRTGLQHRIKKYSISRTFARTVQQYPYLTARIKYVGPVPRGRDIVILDDPHFDLEGVGMVRPTLVMGFVCFAATLLLSWLCARRRRRVFAMSQMRR